MKFLVILLITFYILFNFVSADRIDDVVQIDTKLGKILGKVTDTGRIFRGIPFASSKRFSPSEVTTSLPSSPYQAFEDYPACYQACHLPPRTCPEKMSEDCLGLNVFTPPIKSASTKYPVMVFFHGGNYKQGFGGGPLYNGTILAQLGDVVVVTVNYRLGSLGFAGIPESNIPANLGLIDQINSLKWVNQFIDDFNGNKNNVTIFGQSAGAGSVASHVLMDQSKDLFHRGILLSNPFGIQFLNEKRMKSLTDAFSTELGCSRNDRNCFMNKPIEDIINAQVATENNPKAFGDLILSAFLPWRPSIDNVYIKDQPLVAFKNGQFNTKVDLILGTVSEESIIFIYEAFKKPVDSLSYATFVTIIFGIQNAGKVLKRFPSIDKNDNRDQLSNAGNGFIFNCPNRYAVDYLKQASKGKIYLYSYEHALSFGPQAWGEDFKICYDHVCHAAELPILWYSAGWLFDYTPEESVLAKSMGSYFTNFAATGIPNLGHNSVPVNWDYYGAKNGTLRLSTQSTGGIRMESNLYKDICDFWDTIGY